jgi:hypothetical protein
MQLLVHLESNPYPVHLGRNTPVYQTLQCVAEHAPGVPRKLRNALVRGRKSDRQLKKAEEIVFQDNAIRSLAGTTQAADMCVFPSVVLVAAADVAYLACRAVSSRMHFRSRQS